MRQYSALLDFSQTFFLVMKIGQLLYSVGMADDF